MTYQLSEPWMQEPGYARFTLNDFECAIIRHQELGHLCGYVGLFRHHAMFEMPSEDFHAVSVHGGITYASHFIVNRETGTIRNSPGIWWIGFDCAHSDDYLPYSLSPSSGEYRSFGFVFRELQALTARLRP